MIFSNLSSQPINGLVLVQNYDTHLDGTLNGWHGKLPLGKSWQVWTPNCAKLPTYSSFSKRPILVVSDWFSTVALANDPYALPKTKKGKGKKEISIPRTSSGSLGFSHFSPSVMIFLIMPPSLQMSFTLDHERSSTSNWRVALGGMVGGEPDSPYASSAGIVKIEFSPFFIVPMPISHPFITCPGI